MRTPLILLGLLTFTSAFGAVSQMSTLREGTYHVTLECREPDPKVCEILKGAHTLAIMNVQTRGIALVSIRPRSGRGPLYGFESTAIDEYGYVMDGVWSKGYPVAEIHLDLSDTESQILGWIRDPRFAHDIRIRGTQVVATHGYFQTSDSEPLALSDVLGRYNGTMNGRKVSMVIQKSLVGPALLATVKDSLMTLRFGEGVLDENQRVVMLWRSDEDNKPFQKLILPLETREGTLTSEGVSFLGASGNFSKAIFRKE